jgi:adenine-specific DNA glycosylase
MSPSMSREEYEIIVKDIPYDVLVKELMHRLARGEEVKRYLKVVEEFANTK